MQLSHYISGIFFIVVGLCSAAYLFYTLLRSYVSRGWPATTGKVLESHYDEDSDGCMPHVRYAYTVDGAHYTNNRLYFHTCNRSTKQDTRKHLSPYPVGKAVSIYYNPSKPVDAVLDRHIPLWHPLFWLFFASIFIVVGVALLRDEVTPL